MLANEPVHATRVVAWRELYQLRVKVTDNKHVPLSQPYLHEVVQFDPPTPNVHDRLPVVRCRAECSKRVVDAVEQPDKRVRVVLRTEPLLRPAPLENVVTV